MVWEDGGSRWGLCTQCPFSSLSGCPPPSSSPRGLASCPPPPSPAHLWATGSWLLGDGCLVTTVVSLAEACTILLGR